MTERGESWLTKIKVWSIHSLWGPTSDLQLWRSSGTNDFGCEINRDPHHRAQICFQTTTLFSRRKVQLTLLACLPSAQRDWKACMIKASKSWTHHKITYSLSASFVDLVAFAEMKKGLTEMLSMHSQNRWDPAVWELCQCSGRLKFPGILVRWNCTCIWKRFSFV